jgi:beta-galactosidase
MISKAWPVTLPSKANHQDLNESEQQTSKAALEFVRNDGTRLVLWPDNNRIAEAFAKQLGRLGIIKYSGDVGNLNAPWFGSWNFVRKHWLLTGLPVDCTMDWRYGISAFNGPAWLQEKPGGSITDGYLMDAPGMQTFVGFGADHNPHVGVAGCVIPCGKGEIVFYSLPQMVTSL